jgi:hypothetical protein
MDIDSRYLQLSIASLQTFSVYCVHFTSTHCLHRSESLQRTLTCLFVFLFFSSWDLVTSSFYSLVLYGTTYE